MALQWQRWLKYAKAALDQGVRDSNEELDRLEAEQAARAEGKPWLSSSGDAPTLDEVRARIEHDAREAGPPAVAPATPGEAGASARLDAQPPVVTAAGDADVDALAVEAEARQKAASERLAAIRDELGLADDEDPPPPA